MARGWVRIARRSGTWGGARSVAPPLKSATSLVRHRPALANGAHRLRESHRPGGHPPFEDVVGEPSGVDGGVQVAQATRLVQIAREDREASKRLVRLLAERAVRHEHALAAKRRSIGKVPSLE